MAKFIRNPGGHVHSIEDDAFEAMLEGDGDTDQKYLPHGYKELSEDEAREANPQLFGAADPNVEAARVLLGYQPAVPPPPAKK
jgi:hypothetical protein